MKFVCHLALGPNDGAHGEGSALPALLEELFVEGLPRDAGLPGTSSDGESRRGVLGRPYLTPSSHAPTPLAAWQQLGSERKFLFFYHKGPSKVKP